MWKVLRLFDRLHVCYIGVDMISVRASDKRVTGEGEYSDSEDEGEGGGRKDRANYKPKAKRMKTDSEEKKEAGDKGKGLNSKAGDIKSDRLIAKADQIWQGIDSKARWLSSTGKKRINRKGLITKKKKGKEFMSNRNSKF